MTQRIVLATDGSENAHQAAWLVAHMAAGDPVDVTIVTVIQMPEVGGMVAVESWLPELLEREQQQANEVYEATAKLFEGTQANLRGVRREGLIGYEIVSEAESMGADLIVIGAKGHSAIDRILLGSVSDYVATHAPCSVLVVRPTGIDGQDTGPLRVAIGYDDSHSSLAAIKQLSQFRMDREISLDVLAICQVVRTFRQDLLPNVVEARAKLRETFQTLADEAAAALRCVTPQVQPHVIEAEHVGTAITDFTEAHHSHILVVGDTERGVLGRLFMGERLAVRAATRHLFGLDRATGNGTDIG